MRSATITLFISVHADLRPTSELFGRVGQIAGIRLDHTPVVHQAAEQTHHKITVV